MKQTELQNAYSHVSQGFHDALLSAVSEIREEAPVKKRHISLMVALLIVALLCGTAFAILNYYSVRDFQAGGKPSAAFEKLVVAIGETYENGYITLTVGDTIFDGQNIALTMNLYSKDEQKPVFLFPQLKAYCPEGELTVDIEGMRGDFHSGFLYPNIIEGDTLEHQYGLDAAVLEDIGEGEITWKLTMMVLAPNWPIANDSTQFHGDENDPPIEEYLKRFRDAYDRREILVTGGESLVMYVSAIASDTYGVLTKDDPNYRTLGEELAQSGAFTLVDTLECTFKTGLPEVTKIAGLAFDFGDYSAELDSLALSALRADYSLRHIYPAGGNPPEDVRYELRDQHGRALPGMWSHSSSDGSSVTYAGTAGPPQDGLTAVTFVPYLFVGDGEGGMRILYDESHAFTVELPAGKGKGNM
ncbi:MAG: DUF4179 domain-containing protein [Candidatus Limiplasma sp.]|nr:DUF4179 domain-containing protein [Candidatus Limiplasma sp.]